MQAVVVARIAAEHGTAEGFAFLLRIMTRRIQISDIYTEIRSLVDISCKIKRKIVLSVIGCKTFLLRNIGVSNRCAIELNIL